MGSFSALSFGYDGRQSEDYGLYIGEFSPQSISNGNASNNSEFVQDYIKNRIPFIYGVEQAMKNLEFELNMFSYNYMSRNDISYIDSWLFNNKTPKQLIIYQENMANYYYNCIFSKNEIINHGNLPIGFKCKVICDSPYAYFMPQTEVYTLTRERDTLVRFNNLSDDFGYLYPTLEWTCNKPNGELYIVNKSDNNRSFQITGLSNGEKITIDKYFQIESSMGLLRSENCNKQWLRLKNGINNLYIKGDAGKLYMKYQFKKAIGA